MLRRLFRRWRTPADEPAPMMQSLEGFAWGDELVRVRERRPASDAVVAACPGLFVPAGLEDERFEAARRRLYDERAAV